MLQIVLNHLFFLTDGQMWHFLVTFNTDAVHAPFALICAVLFRIKRCTHGIMHVSEMYKLINIGLQFLVSGLSISHEIRRISGEIHPKPYKIRCFNKNYSVWWMQERGYDLGFHEIWGHSPLHAPPKLKSFCWNIWFYKVLGGFQVKSARFHECELLGDDQV